MKKKLIQKKLETSVKRKLEISKLSFLKRLFYHPSMFLHTITCFLLRRFKLTKLVRAKTFFDQDMIVVLPEVVSSDIYRFGYIELNVAQAIINNVSEKDKVIDIGSHFGLFTLLMCEMVGDDGEVHSFEPVPSTFSILSNNVSKKKSVTTNLKAVWNENKKIIVNDYGISFSAFNSIKGARSFEIQRQKFKNIINAKAVKLDDYIKQKNIKPSFIKIDAESTEYEVLEGMSYILNKIKPTICIELGDLEVDGAHKSIEVVKHLLNYGYKPFEFKENKFIKHEIRQNYPYTNLLFISD
tara:strand:+ start:6774 stop:7664 length:891 start_codon:yes stop_codon:yes gene_type:complete